MISLKPKSLLPFLMRDALLLIAAFTSLYLLNDYDLTNFEWFTLFSCIFFLLLIEFFGKPNGPKMSSEIRQSFSNHIIAYMVSITLLVVLYFTIPIEWHHRGRFLALLTIFFMLDITVNYFLGGLIKRAGTNIEHSRNILVAGTGLMAKNIERQMFHRPISNDKVVGFINCNSHEVCEVGKEKVLGDMSDIHQYLLSNSIDEIVIAIPGNYTTEIQDVVAMADYHGVRVKYILDYQEVFGRHYKITRYGQMNAINIRQFPLDNYGSIILKNCFDKVFAVFALLLLAPVFIIVAILVKLDSPGPVFYAPIRIGKGGKPFKLYKFRSMRENDAASGGILSTQKNDPRITTLGRILRKYSIDELPQFLNVLLGTMSVVGPRPHRRFLNRQLQECVYKYMIRHYVKPGITGWAQVNGWRGPTDTDEQRKQRTLHDLWYIENWSFMLDIKIVYKTIFSSKVHKSAY
jgi:Undecaprenyl-phosphate glucose phosphotransferase